MIVIFVVIFFFGFFVVFVILLVDIYFIGWVFFFVDDGVIGLVVFWWNENRWIVELWIFVFSLCFWLGCCK